MHLKHIKTCRICKSSSLTDVINLGSQYLQGSFLKPGKEVPSLRKVPVSLVRCDPVLDERACGLLQMTTSVPPEILYSAYWYRSGTNQTMRDHLKQIAIEAKDLINLKSASVLDIGCNDGTLLKNYPRGFKKFGIDPSDISQEVGNDVTLVQDIFPSKELDNKLKGKKLDIITSIAMFYDLEDPSAFVNNIKDILDKKGIWIFEMSYMPLMLKMNSYDTICHEHLEYYSFSVIENLLSLNDLKIFKLNLNDINGGSIRCYATHKENFKFKNQSNLKFIDNVRKEEFDMELDTDKPYKNFQSRIEKHKIDLMKLLNKIKNKNKSIHIYGASTKGNTILQWCGIDNKIVDFAADRNPDKDGAKTIGTNIPIISEAKSRKLNPDYYLVLPWHFKKEFLKRESETIKKGTKFIFPLPNIEIFPK